MERIRRRAAGGQASPLGEAPERSEGEGEQDAGLNDKVLGESDKGRTSPPSPGVAGSFPPGGGRSPPLAVGFRLSHCVEGSKWQ